MFMWTPLFQVLSEQEVSGPTALTKDGVVAAVVSLLTEKPLNSPDCCSIWLLLSKVNTLRLQRGRKLQLLWGVCHACGSYQRSVSRILCSHWSLEDFLTLQITSRVRDDALRAVCQAGVSVCGSLCVCRASPLWRPDEGQLCFTGRQHPRLHVHSLKKWEENREVKHTDVSESTLLCEQLFTPVSTESSDFSDDREDQTVSSGSLWDTCSCFTLLWISWQLCKRVFMGWFVPSELQTMWPTSAPQRGFTWMSRLVCSWYWLCTSMLLATSDLQHRCGSWSHLHTIKEVFLYLEFV